MIENRYLKLQEAVDFFSQSLHVEQLMAYGYELIHRSLSLKQSALFMLQEQRYTLLMQNHYEITAFDEPENPNHKLLAERFGRVLTKDFERYFSEVLVSSFHVEMVIPIINKEHLVGFILSSGTNFGLLDDEILEFTSSINQLMNKAYEHASAYSALEIKNLELDKRVFNLFFINHSSRLLMSELNLNQLYSLCVDIVRELTASAITTFFVTDESSQKMLLKGYKNIVAFDQYYDELAYPRLQNSPIKAVYHMGTEREALEQIVQDLTPLDNVKAEHVIFIVKEKVLGLITISKPVNHSDYDKTVLELIVSIANSIYIAMNNAIQFHEIQVQERQLAAKVQAISSLNRSIKNIQSCQTIDEMIEIVMQTLLYGFGVERLAILLEDEKSRVCVSHHGFDEKPNWLETLTDKQLAMQVAFTENQASQIVKTLGLEERYLQDDHNCLIILPIEMDVITEAGQLRLGTLFIDKLSHPLQPQDEMAFEALVNAIAPYIYWHKQESKCKNEHNERAEIKLKRLLNEAYRTFVTHQIPYWAYVKPIQGSIETVLLQEREGASDAHGVIIGAYYISVSHHERFEENVLAIEGQEVDLTLAAITSILL